MTQWDDSFQQAGDGLTLVLYECRKWRFYSSTTATGESKEGKDEKLLGTIQRTLYLWNYMALSLCPSPIPFNILVLNASLFKSQQGYNISFITFSLLFLGLTTLLLGSVDSLELSAVSHTVSVYFGTPQTWLPFVWDHDCCVSLTFVVSFSQDSCHVSFSFTRYFLLVLIGGFSPPLWAAAFLPSVSFLIALAVHSHLNFGTSLTTSIASGGRMVSSNWDSTPPSSPFLVIEPVGRVGSEEMVGVETILSFSCCLYCPAWELKPCFSVSATEQQQNQYSKHCKRNTPSADVHGIFPKCYFFPCLV